MGASGAHDGVSSKECRARGADIVDDYYIDPLNVHRWKEHEPSCPLVPQLRGQFGSVAGPDPRWPAHGCHAPMARDRVDCTKKLLETLRLAGTAWNHGD